MSYSRALLPQATQWYGPRMGRRTSPVCYAAADSSSEEDASALEGDFSALSDDVEKLAAECALKLDGVTVFLVGMMGSGKSTVGQLLAKFLNYCFFDSDSLIEELAQKDIPTMFKEDGEETFREVETQVLAELGAYKTCVIATGGGAVVAKKNWAYLQNGVVVYLQGDAELLAKRVVGDGTDGRPMLDGSNDEVEAALERINGLLNDRVALYERADVTVSLAGTDRDEETGAPPAVVVHRLLTQLLAKLDEKIEIDNEAARKEFEIEDKGPMPISGPMPKPSGSD